MYYKEEIINGVLCYKTTPDGEWIAFTPEKLTAKITELQTRFAHLKIRFDSLCDRLENHNIM
jgi:hypothetical protein